MAVWAWYTKGRRLPTLIGKDVSGKRIPGGPYTGLQAVTVLVVPTLGWTTRGPDGIRRAIRARGYDAA